MVKLVRLEKRVVLDGGLVAEIGDAIASSASELVGKASAGSAATLEVMDQVLDSLGDLAIAPINDAVQEGAAELSRLADAVDTFTLVFVDGNVGDIDLIRTGMAPGAEVHIIDIKRDGLTQIAEVMAGRSDIGAVHIISHGAPGALSLGNATVEFDALSTAQQSVLTQIGQAMTEQGDILIYGCDFAAGDAGAQAVTRMATLTGADVAASVDRTGAAELGGDWDLEVAQGLIETAIVLDHPTRDEMTVALAAVSDVTGINFGSDSTANPLVAWLDASTLNLTNGDDVNSWNSTGRGGAEAFDTATTVNGIGRSATAPTYSDANNGTVVFTASSSQALVMDLSVNGKVDSGAYEVFFVGSINDLSTNGWGRVVTFMDSASNANDYTGNGLAAILAQGGVANSNRNLGVYKDGIGAGVAIDDTDTHLVSSSGTGGGASQAVALDGGTAATASQGAASLSADRINLGGRFGSASPEFSSMTVNELIVFDRQLNAAERSIINSYLAEKWGLTVSNDRYEFAGAISGGDAHDMAGIGKEADGSSDTAESGGLTITSSLSGGLLQDVGDYFMVANDAATSASDGSIVIAAENIDFAGRKWAGDLSDGAGTTAGNIDLVFDLGTINTNLATDGASDAYRLLVDSDNDGTFDTVLGSSTDKSVNDVTFGGVDASALEGKTFTIGLVAADSAGPTVSGIAISSDSGGQNNTLNAGDTLYVTVTMDEATNVTGTPQLALNIGGSTVQADYASGTGTTNLVFSYTIQAGQTDIDGISVDIDSLSLNGGTLRDAALNDATLTHAAVGDNASYLVDTGAPTASVTTATLNDSGNAVVQSNEIGTAYLVNDNVTVSSLADITGAADNQFNQVSITQADTATDLSTAGLADGSYRVYT
ncbi:MAG: DUF4347 domain-containing protein, partial [Gammaproteobacteria bacterium]|nr:DUF4347 domain-containing protein [Gammaproteobacteria bacterium]